MVEERRWKITGVVYGPPGNEEPALVVRGPQLPRLKSVEVAEASKLKEQEERCTNAEAAVVIKEEERCDALERCERLEEALTWLLTTTERHFEEKPVRNLDEVLSFARTALQHSPGDEG